MWPVSFVLSALLYAMQFIPGTQQPGTIAGRVDIRIAPPEQVASRYPTPGGQLQKSIAPIPTVVFIDGPVAGTPPFPKLARASIIQKGLEFSPSLLIIPRNTAVAFPNEDSEFHNVFSYSKAKRFDLGRYPKGESKSVIFDHPGIVKIYCEVHPWMRAAVLVLENPFYAIVSEEGTFAIKGIPAGHHTLVIWNIDAGSKKVDVEVKTSGSPELALQLSGRFEARLEEGVVHPKALMTETPVPAEGRPEGTCCARKR